jgi:hypothetical protein
MCAPDSTVYLLIGTVVQQILVGEHATSVRAIKALVWALLRAQSLHGADLARAVPDLRAPGARQGRRRVRRNLGGASLGSQRLSPLLVRVALVLVGDGEVVLVLDSTRCLCWEIFTLGVRVGGRVLPIAWAVLPYPWPKKQFTPTVVALLERTLGRWPPERAVHLLADRGFPSQPLFRCLQQHQRRLHLGYTIRLRASDYVRDATGQSVKVADLLAQRPASGFGAWPASYQPRGPVAPAATLSIGQQAVPPPAHQRGPADVARRQARAQRRVAHVRSKGQPHAPQTDRVWSLLSTEPTAEAAVARYSGRFATEGTYRDLKTWDLEEVAARETDAGHLDGLLGLAALGYLVQAAVGMAAGRASQDQARARQRQWSTTDRLSIFWRGRQVLHDHAHDWTPWLGTCLRELTHRLSPPADRPVQLPLPLSYQEAA